MTTRSGSVDPGALVYLLRERGLEADELDRALNTESGLAALAGREGRDLEAAAAGGDADAELALEVFAHRVAGAVAAMAVAAGRLDALVFTAGIGENSPRIRERICGRLRLIGVHLDPDANEPARSDGAIHADGSVPVLVVRAREELVIARAVRGLL
jgi:acetate kinase